MHIELPKSRRADGHTTAPTTMYCIRLNALATHNHNYVFMLLKRKIILHVHPDCVCCGCDLGNYFEYECVFFCRGADLHRNAICHGRYPLVGRELSPA